MMTLNKGNFTHEKINLGYDDLSALYQSRWCQDAQRSGVGNVPKMTVFSLPRLSEYSGALMTTGFKT